MAYEYGGFGALRFPVDATGLEYGYDLDPGHKALAGLIQGAINAKLGDAWRALMTDVVDTHPLRKATEPCPTIHQFEPTPERLNTVMVQSPFLCVYPVEQGQTEWVTLSRKVLRQGWAVDYIVGLADVEMTTRLSSFCRAVLKVAIHAVEHGADAGYELGVRQFYGQFASINALSTEGPALLSVAGGETAQGYLGVSLRVETTERDIQDASAAPYNGADAPYVPAGTGRGESPVFSEPDVGFDNKTADP